MVARTWVSIGWRAVCLMLAQGIAVAAVAAQATDRPEWMALEPAPREPDETDGAATGEPDLGVKSAQAGMFLPLTEAPRTDTQRAFATALGGYDFAHRTARLEGRAEVTVFGPLALRVGTLYTQAPEQLRPSVGARVQALSQASGQGVDMSIGVFYKPEGFTEAEGEIEGVVALGRTIDRLALLLNLAYGQDPEGRERDGELRAAALYALVGGLQFGLDTRLRLDLGTEEDKLEDEGGAKVDLAAGPLVSYAFDRFALGLQTGLSVVGFEGGDTRAGALVLGSLSGAL